MTSLNGLNYPTDAAIPQPNTAGIPMNQAYAQGYGILQVPQDQNWINPNMPLWVGQQPIRPIMSIRTEQEEILELAKEIYLQKIRLPVIRSDLSDLVKQSIDEAYYFVVESKKYIKAAPDSKTAPEYGDMHSKPEWLAFSSYTKVGRRIDALKEYRTITGQGLIEAKHYLDGYELWLKSNPQIATALDSPTLL